MWIESPDLALRLEAGRIAERAGQAPPGALRCKRILPAFIDAHVHLAFAGMPVEALLRAGIAAVLDLGAPVRMLPLSTPPLRTVFSGPLLTEPRGYPTQTWGKDGYGLELSDPEAARDTVQRLAALGARFIKLTQLAPEVAAAAVDEAHRLGLLVAAHALEVDPVRRALDAGVDVLAHTPREVLPPELLDRMRGKWVISTLRAFDVPPERLAALHEAGARVAYGTDLGNDDTRPEIDRAELSLLKRAGVDPLCAATADAAVLLGLADLGQLEVGSQASLLLEDPDRVMICGTLVA